MNSVIYRDMDQTTLDAAYNNLAAVENSAEIIHSWTTRSHLFRTEHPASVELAYGPSVRQRIDYFCSGCLSAPLFVFIHGGYWQRNSKDMFSFIARGLVSHGIDVAVIGYTLAPQARLSTINSEISQAIDYLYETNETPGFDVSRIFVGGWSAGGHLAALAARNSCINAVFSISGIFDLEPIALSYINQQLHLDKEEIERLSPLKQMTLRPVCYYLYVGIDELPELRHQSARYAKALQNNELDVEFKTLKRRNHFTILDELDNPEGLIKKAITRYIFT